MDSPRLDRESDLAHILAKLNSVYTAVFTVELLLKSVAYGFAFGPTAYLKSAWNRLDFFIVLISLSQLFAELLPQLTSLNSLRILRVLRPLRLLARNEGMRVILISLVKAGPAVGNVLGVLVAFMLVFSILGMQIFSGTFGYCTDPNIRFRVDCVESPRLRLLSAYNYTITPTLDHRHLFAPMHSEQPSSVVHISPLRPTSLPPSPHPLDHADTAESGNRHLVAIEWRDYKPKHLTIATRRQGARHRHRRLKGGGGGGGGGGGPDGVSWVNPPFGSFDDFGQAMLLLFIASTGDGWEDIMFAGMDATAPGEAPERNDFSPASLFFIAWIFVGSFIALNLFVGAIVDNFTRIKNESDGSATMTAGQKQWVEAMKQAASSKPPRATRLPKSSLRKVTYGIVSSRAFEALITSVIVLNIVAMSLDYWRIEDDELVYSAYSTAMSVFTYVYYVEAVLKLTALGGQYFSDNWCRFDFFLVCTSLLDQFAADSLASYLPVPPMLLRVLRVFRIFRIFRLIRGYKGLKDLLMTIVLSIPALINVTSLLGLVVFMYAVLGMQLFTFVKHQELINEDRNFETFGAACLVLIQCITGDGWSTIMAECGITPELGCSEEDGNCGSPFAVTYFVSFELIASFVMLNLIVAVILENFSTLGSQRTDLVSADDISHFREVWVVFDPDADGKMPTSQLTQLVTELRPPLGLKGENTNPRIVARMCLKLKLAQHDGFLLFAEVLDALVNQNFQGSLADEFDDTLMRADSVKKVIEKRRSSVSTPLALGKLGGDNAIRGPLSERRKGLARIFAEEILTMFVERRRERRRRENAAPPKVGYEPTTGLQSKSAANPVNAAHPPVCALATGGVEVEGRFAQQAQKTSGEDIAVAGTHSVPQQRVESRKSPTKMVAPKQDVPRTAPSPLISTTNNAFPNGSNVPGKSPSLGGTVGGPYVQPAPCGGSFATPPATKGTRTRASPGPRPGAGQPQARPLSSDGKILSAGAKPRKPTGAGRGGGRPRGADGAYMC